jgi:hypothetical protein
MSKVQSIQLSEVVRALAKDFVLSKGRLAMPKDAYLRWTHKLSEGRPNERLRYAEELVALALKFGRMDKVASSEAVRQLATLAAGLIPPPAHRGDGFERGMAYNRLSHFLGR